MAQKVTTLRDLAEHLDVSIATASRALANHPAIAPGTRQRVVEAAKHLGYVPNVAARHLVSGRSGFVCLVLPVHGPNFVDAYLGEYITGLGEGLVAHAMDLFIATAQSGQSELEVLRHAVEGGRADGVVLPRTTLRDERVDYLRRRGVPFVCHGRLLDEDADVDWLDSDGAGAFGEAFDLLYDLGHRRFALVSIIEPMTFGHMREQGLRAAIARRDDADVTLQVVAAPRHDRGATVAAIHSVLHGPERPTAVIGLFDTLALTVMEEAARAGLSIPRDLSVVGFDNIVASAYVSPGLTTFDADTHASARAIAEMIVAAIEGRAKAPQQRLTYPRLVLRASHGPAPMAHEEGPIQGR